MDINGIKLIMVWLFDHHKSTPRSRAAASTKTPVTPKQLRAGACAAWVEAWLWIAKRFHFQKNMEKIEVLEGGGPLRHCSWVSERFPHVTILCLAHPWHGSDMISYTYGLLVICFPLVSTSFCKGIYLLWLRSKYVMAYLFPSAWRNCAIKYQLFIVEGFSICHDTAGTSLTLNWVRPVRCGICFSMTLICCSTVSYAFCSNMYFPLQMHNAGFGWIRRVTEVSHWKSLEHVGTGRCGTCRHPASIPCCDSVRFFLRLRARCGTTTCMQTDQATNVTVWVWVLNLFTCTSPSGFMWIHTALPALFERESSKTARTVKPGIWFHEALNRSSIRSVLWLRQ